MDFSEAGHEEDLQFQVDGLVFPTADVAVASDRAYTRAVWIPFVDQERAAPVGKLECTVQKLVAEYLDAAAGSAVGGSGDVDLLGPLVAHLSKHGLRAVISGPPKPSAAAPLSTRSINAPFLIVTQPTAADDLRYEGIGDLGQVHDQKAVKDVKEAPAVVIVDAAVREQLALAPATDSYRRALTDTVPEVFVGTRARLVRLVTGLGPVIAANFSAQGMEVPPWRRKAALLHRWAGVANQERMMRVRWEDERAAPAPPAAPAAPVEGLAAPEWPEVAWAEGMPALDAAVEAATTASVVPIVGFVVGSAAAVGREPWHGTRPGAFSSSVFRRPSLAESEVSSADSDEVIAGLSPVSVFREALPRAVPAPAKVSVGFA